MRLGTHQECVGSSPRVSGVYQDGAKEFAGRRPRLIERLSRVTERLAGMKAHRAFARTLPKVSGRSLGTRREITRGRP
ncbi:hypothetical protein GW17_00055623 [Ensete ventricosum]|nr:hypothetical protein GW17_00055623 [Ensete ventricosum]